MSSTWRYVALGVLFVVIVGASVLGWYAWRSSRRHVTQAVLDLASNAYRAEQQRVHDGIQAAALQCATDWYAYQSSEMLRIRNEIDAMSDDDYWDNLERLAGTCRKRSTAPD